MPISRCSDGRRAPVTTVANERGRAGGGAGADTDGGSSAVKTGSSLGVSSTDVSGMRKNVFGLPRRVPLDTTIPLLLLEVESPPMDGSDDTVLALLFLCAPKGVHKKLYYLCSCTI